MQLELKESNSPFWLIGLLKGKQPTGSETNVPCFHKSSKKQHEIATKMIKDYEVDEVYLLTGVEWDNLKGSWNRKEAGAYIQNKGKLISSANENTKYDEKYNSSKVVEGDYPKGVSRDPLPKKGVKTYTSVATALEDKGDEKMKLELNAKSIVKEEMTPVDNIPEDLQDRFFTTMGDGRPEMFKKFTKDELKLFADFVKQLPDNEITNLERSLVLVAISLAHGDDLTVESIKESTQDLVDKFEIDVQALKSEGYDLVVFRCHTCAEDLKEYNPYIYDDGKEIPLDKIKVIEVESHDEECENSEKNMHAKPQNYAPIALWKYSKVDVVKESYSKDEFIKKTAYCTSKYDIYYLKNNKDNFFVMKKGETPWENKELAQTDIDGVKHVDKLKLKESKIVTPVGNPQTAGSFVNIDVDLDHMEVSDFIVRLAQAIRSEQTSVLEYVALRSANGITNEERTNIDAIIEEEKNHMVAFITMLYKQILTNHKQNVDGANEEFELPTFGMEIFDNSEDGKLTESVSNTVEKIAAKEAGIRMSDEFFIGNREEGRMYHGLSQALNVVKNIISTSGKEVVIQNVTLSDDLTEAKKDDEIKEDISVKHDGGTLNQEQWDIVVDVDYDNDFQLQVVNNLTNAIQELNRETGKALKYGIAEDKYTLAGEKFNFVIITLNDFEGTVDETFVAEVCDKLFERASTYEYYIKRA